LGKLWTIGNKRQHKLLFLWLLHGPILNLIHLIVPEKVIRAKCIHMLTTVNLLAHPRRKTHNITLFHILSWLNFHISLHFFTLDVPCKDIHWISLQDCYFFNVVIFKLFRNYFEKILYQNSILEGRWYKLNI
jgi:hypothetical protein